MAFDYSKLRGKIVEIFNTQSSFAVAMGWSERTLSLKINSLRPWKQPDICRDVKLLGLTDEDIPTYFFTTEVQNSEKTRRTHERLKR